MSHTTEYDVKRQDIILCAAHLFRTKGYEPTTVNDILRAVGIAKGTFYYYFKSKEQVMDAVIMKTVDQKIEDAKKIVQDNSMNTVDKLLVLFFDQPKSAEEKQLIEQLYEVDNALMKQRAMQKTLELLCPIYAEIVAIGNQQQECVSENPLIDCQFFIAGIQTLYDFMMMKNSAIHVDSKKMIDLLFQVLTINEDKISKEYVAKKMNTIVVDKGGKNE